jgi:hypothetical protein
LFTQLIVQGRPPLSDETTSAFLIVEVLEKFRVSLIGADRGSLGQMKIHSVFVLLRLAGLTLVVFRVPGSVFPVSGCSGSALRQAKPLKKACRIIYFSAAARIV